MAEAQAFNENELPALREEIRSLAVEDADSYQYADTRLALIKRAQKYFKELHRGNIERTKLAYDGARKDLKNFIDPLEDDERTLKNVMGDYDTEQRKIAERRTLELQKEEQLKADQEALEVAELLESVGQKQEAESVLDRPNQAPPVVVKADTPKSETSHYAVNWYYEVINFADLIAAVANGLSNYAVFMVCPEEKDPSQQLIRLAANVPIKALEYSKDFLNRQAKAQKEALDYPGVKVKWKRDIRSRS